MNLLRRHLLVMTGPSPFLTLLLLLAASCGASAGCTSTGVGNPAPKQMTLELSMDEEPEPEATSPDMALPHGSVERAVLVLGEVRLEPCDPSLDPVVSQGPFVVDLIAGTSTPSLPVVDAPEGGFCSLAAPLAPAKRPASLTGRSLFFSGKRADGTPFLLFASASATLRVEARGDGAWARDDSEALLWAFRPRRWLDAMELDTAETDMAQPGLIVIDANRHPLLYVAILSRLAGRSSLHSDINEDGVLQDDERSNAWVGIGLGTTD